MTGSRLSRPRLVRALLWAAAVSVGLLEAAPVPAKPPAETPDAANAFLDRFIGSWIGEGPASGASGSRRRSSRGVATHS